MRTVVIFVRLVLVLRKSGLLQTCKAGRSSANELTDCILTAPRVGMYNSGRRQLLLALQEARLAEILFYPTSVETRLIRWSAEILSYITSRYDRATLPFC